MTVTTHPLGIKRFDFGIPSFSSLHLTGEISKVSLFWRIFLFATISYVWGWCSWKSGSVLLIFVVFIRKRREDEAFLIYFDDHHLAT